MVYDHLIAKLKEEKDPMNDYFEDLQRKMRLMNQKLLEEAKERKFLKKVKNELETGLAKLEKEEREKKDKYTQKHMRITRMLSKIQHLGT
jgi:chromosome segregation ATPase